MIIQFLEDLGRFGRGISNTSLLLVLHCLFPQLPRIGPNAAEPCTRSETVFKQNWLTVGLSLRPPARPLFSKEHFYRVSLIEHTPPLVQIIGMVSSREKSELKEEIDVTREHMFNS